jgi:hypothetical protein
MYHGFSKLNLQTKVLTFADFAEISLLRKMKVSKNEKKYKMKKFEFL